MLRLWILLVLAAGLLVGCGGNDGQETGQVETEATSTTAQGNGSAGDVIVEYFTLLAAGDSLAGGDYFADEVMQSLGGEENFQAAQAMQRLQLEERGGLSGIVVIDEQVQGEQSMVTFEITTVGGTVDTGQALLVLREGEWKWIR